MRYKIQDANKTFKSPAGPLCLLDAKNLFPHGSLFFYAGCFFGAFVHRGQHAGIFGPKPSLYFAEPYLFVDYLDFCRHFGNNIYGLGLDFVKIYVHKKDNHASFLYNLHNPFACDCPFGANCPSFGGRNSINSLQAPKARRGCSSKGRQ